MRNGLRKRYTLKNAMGIPLRTSDDAEHARDAEVHTDLRRILLPVAWTSSGLVVVANAAVIVLCVRDAPPLREAWLIGFAFFSAIVSLSVCIWLQRVLNRAITQDTGQSVATFPQDEKVHARAAELTQLSRHLIRVAEEEKSQFARELHDTFGSNLTAINMDLNWIAKRLPAERPELQDRLQRALGMLGATVHSTQEAIDRLRPSQLDNLGLAVALRSHCRDLEERIGLACRVEAAEDFESLDRTRAITLYRVAQEALANVEKHAHAAMVEVQLLRETSGIRLRIWNDGVGFLEGDASLSEMVGIRERIESLGGTLNVEGAREGGTQIDAFIPEANEVT